MNENLNRKPGHSAAALAAGLLLTLVALVAHRFLPERRLSLDPAREGAVFFVMKSGEEALTHADWVDMQKMHFQCRFAKEATGAGCSFAYLLYPETAADHGMDLSQFRRLNLDIKYRGSAHHLRVAIRNFDRRYSRLEDSNSSKFNSVNLKPKDLKHPVSVVLHEFAVPEWWVAQYDLPRELAQPQLDNATAFSIDLVGDNLAGSEHDIRIDKIEFALGAPPPPGTF